MALVKCKFCGGDIADTTPKCPHCGNENPFFRATMQNENTVYQKKYSSNPFSLIFSLIGITVGIITIIVGGFIQTSNYSYVKDVTFKADFYTEMYAVTADALRALRSISSNLNRLCGTILIAFGSFEVCLFGSKLDSKK